MELPEAIATVRGLGNLFSGFRKIEDVLAAAQQADNLTVEKQKLIDDKTAELAQVQANLDAAHGAALAQAQKDQNDFNVRTADIAAQSEELLRAFAAVRTQLDVDQKAAQVAHDDAVASLAADINKLTVQKDDLTAQVLDLTDQLAQLKARVASV